MRIAVTSHYLDEADCHRGFTAQFDDFKLGSALHQIKDLPAAWSRKFLEQMEVGKYTPTKIADLCTLNGVTFPSIIEMGYYLCENALNDEQRTKLRAITKEFGTKELDNIFSLLKRGKLVNATMQIPAALDIEVPDRIWEIMGQIGTRVNMDDLQILAKYIISDPNFMKNLPHFMKAVGKIESIDLLTLKNATKKVNVDNVALIDHLVSQLNVSMVEMIVNPSKMMELYRDPELTKIVNEVRELMPVLDENDLNAMLRVKKVFEETSGSGYVVNVLLRLPLDFTFKFTDIELRPEDVDTMRSLQGILEDPRIKGVIGVAGELGFFDGREGELECSHDSLKVECTDSSEQLCLELQHKGCHLAAEVY